MSTGEHHALIDVLRQNPELLKEVENDQPNACGRTDTVRDEESDARLGSTAEAPDINDWPEPLLWAESCRSSKLLTWHSCQSLFAPWWRTRRSACRCPSITRQR